MISLIAISPFILLLGLIFIWRKSLFESGMITAALAATLALFVWKIQPNVYAGVLSKALISSLEIALIVFGAMVFLGVMKTTRVLSSLEHYLKTISPDIRIQTILIIWFFSSFLEGTAGFGSPLLVVVPLLIQLGFTAPSAIVIGLVGNSTAVAFGAIGTPIKIGLAEYATSSSIQAIALFDLFAGLTMPFLILWATRARIPQRSVRYFRDIAFFALFAGASMMIPYYFVATQMGPDFPSIIGPATGLLITVTTLKLGFFKPRRILQFTKVDPNHNPLHILHVLAPYGVLVGLLLVSRYALPNTILSLPGGGKHTLSFFNPGVALFVTSMLFVAIHKVIPQTFARITKESAARAAKVTGAIFVMIAISQLYTQSAINSSGLGAMGSYLANILTPLPFFIASPLLGAFGAFMAGSATVSNILFAPIQTTIAMSAGISGNISLALQTLGATAGTMISLITITSVYSIIGKPAKTRQTILAVLPYMLTYLGVISALGFIAGKLGG